jgi:hypothetical protein
VPVAACVLSGTATAQAIPTVTIVDGPPIWTAETSATFHFETSEPTGIDCRLDIHRDASAEWEPCVDGHTVEGPLAEGRHVLEVRADSGGPGDPAQDSWTWRVDVTPPAFPTVFEPERLWQLERHVTVSWGASDVPSGVDSYNLKYDRWTADGSKRRALWLRRTKVTGGALAAGTGRTYCLQAIVRDRAGNLAPSWSQRRCFAVPLGAGALERSDQWRLQSGIEGSFLGGSLWSSQRRAWVRQEVAARRLVLVVTRCPACGAVAVRWRGRVMRTIDLGGSPTRRGMIVPIASFPGRQRGTVRVEVISSGKIVRIEGLGVSAV